MVNDLVKKLIKPTIGLGLLTYALFCLFGHYEAGVLVSICISSSFSLFKLKMISDSLEVALTKSATKAQLYSTGQYMIRFALTGILIYYSLVLSFLNPVAMIIPMFFPKILICWQFFKKGDRE